MKKLTRANDNDDAPACYIENEGRLFELFSEMGLVEENGDGGWDFTKALEAGSILFGREEQQPPRATLGVVLPLKPRTLEVR